MGLRSRDIKRLAQMEEGYQGWKNYETWAVALWLDNYQGSYEYWRERIEELTSEVGPDDAVHELADELQADHEEAKPELDGVWGDLLNGAFPRLTGERLHST